MSARSHSHWLLYDGECGLCRVVAAAALALDRGGRLEALALQSPEAGQLLPGLSPEERLASFHLVEQQTGHVSSAGAGLAELVALLPGGPLTGPPLRAAPGLTERAYRLVADHRSRLGRWIPPATSEWASRRLSR